MFSFFRQWCFCIWIQPRYTFTIHFHGFSVFSFYIFFLISFWKLMCLSCLTAKSCRPFRIRVLISVPQHQRFSRIEGTVRWQKYDGIMIFTCTIPIPIQVHFLDMMYPAKIYLQPVRASSISARIWVVITIRLISIYSIVSSGSFTCIFWKAHIFASCQIGSLRFDRLIFYFLCVFIIYKLQACDRKINPSICLDRDNCFSCFFVKFYFWFCVLRLSVCVRLLSLYNLHFWFFRQFCQFKCSGTQFIIFRRELSFRCVYHIVLIHIFIHR